MFRSCKASVPSVLEALPALSARLASQANEASTLKRYPKYSCTCTRAPKSSKLGINRLIIGVLSFHEPPSIRNPNHTFVGFVGRDSQTHYKPIMGFSGKVHQIFNKQASSNHEASAETSVKRFRTCSLYKSV